jgi:urocanate hydratase
MTTDNPQEEPTKKQRKKYVTQKSQELENLLTAAKEYKFEYKPINIDLKKDKEEVRKLTANTCLRPDLYLNNDDSCVKCYIYDNCACPAKNLGKKNKRQMEFL